MNDIIRMGYSEARGSIGQGVDVAVGSNICDGASVGIAVLPRAIIWVGLFVRGAEGI